MYESYFGLNKRPFLPVPNPDCFIPVGPLQESLKGMCGALSQGSGINLLIGGEGAGKSTLVRHLTKIMGEEFRLIYLSTPTFKDQLGLIQAILYELYISFSGLSLQEATLRLLSAARDLHKIGRPLVVMIDEAHLLSASTLEELRALGEHSVEGEPLMRFVLSGQDQLDELLAEPGLSAFKQRIGCHLYLEPLSLQQAADYVTARLAWAGSRTPDDLFTDEALRDICRAADGNPRCLNQLADHSLLLAFAAEEKPVSRAVVRSALEDLKELHLQWNDLPPIEPQAPMALAEPGKLGDDEELLIDSEADATAGFIGYEPHLSDTDEFDVNALMSATVESDEIREPMEADDTDLTLKFFTAGEFGEIRNVAGGDDEQAFLEYSVLEVGAGLPAGSGLNKSEFKGTVGEVYYYDPDTDVLHVAEQEPSQSSELHLYSSQMSEAAEPTAQVAPEHAELAAVPEQIALAGSHSSPAFHLAESCGREQTESDEAFEGDLESQLVIEVWDHEHDVAEENVAEENFTEENFTERVIYDHYSRIDQRNELPLEQQADVELLSPEARAEQDVGGQALDADVEEEFVTTRVEVLPTNWQQCHHQEADILNSINSLRADLEPLAAAPPVVGQMKPVLSSGPDMAWIEYDVVQPVFEAMAPHAVAPEQVDVSPAIEQPGESVPAASAAAFQDGCSEEEVQEMRQRIILESTPQRRFENLFSRLRWRRSQIRHEGN